MKRYLATLTCLTPVHVGTGEVYEPFDFVIRDKSLIAVDAARALQSMPPQQGLRLEGCLERGDMAQARKLFAEGINVEAEGVALYRAEVSESVAREYRAKLSDPRNQLLIQPCPHRADTGQPVLPGSSIKGAIRTAVLDRLAAKLGQRVRVEMRGNRVDGAGTERNLLGSRDLDEDPFRCLKIRDASFPPGSSRVVDVQNVRRDGTAASIDMRVEVFGEDSSAEFEILLDDRLPEMSVWDPRSDREKKIRHPFDLADVLKDCREYFLPRMKREHERFYQGGRPVTAVSADLLKTAFAQNEFPLRVGRFSQIECMTFSRDHLDEDPLQRVKHGNTRNLAEGRWPMGWVKVSLKEMVD